MLPHWYRGRGELEPCGGPGLDRKLEAMLAAAKGEAALPDGPEEPADPPDFDAFLD